MSAMNDEPELAQLHGSQGLEQFLLLAKSAKGLSAVQLIQDATSSTGLYVFGELLELDCIKELVNTEYAAHYKLLELFTYGTYSDYKGGTELYPQLSVAQLIKLKHLTLITIAAKSRIIPYSVLLSELDIANVRELEDLIIDAIYRNILVAKLDQNNRQVEVECFIGRDFKMEKLGGMIDKLDQWCANCGAVVQMMENQIQRANEMKAQKTSQKETLDKEVKSLKQAVAIASRDLEQASDFQDSAHKFQSAKKGLRGSLVQNK